jgi:hypothetical protein
MEQATNGLPPGRLIQAFERGFAALWGRANRTLADVTLMAILVRPGGISYCPRQPHGRDPHPGAALGTLEGGAK